jgi:serine/threonine protein kinase
MAPEIMKGNEYKNEVDIWAIGILLFELCALERPIKADNIFVFIQKVLDFKKVPQLPEIYSKSTRNMIKSILKVDPKKRPSASKLLENEALSSVDKSENPPSLEQTLSNFRQQIEQKLKIIKLLELDDRTRSTLLKELLDEIQKAYKFLGKPNWLNGDVVSVGSIYTLDTLDKAKLSKDFKSELTGLKKLINEIESYELKSAKSTNSPHSTKSSKKNVDKASIKANAEFESIMTSSSLDYSKLGKGKYKINDKIVRVKTDPRSQNLMVQFNKKTMPVDEYITYHSG